MIAHGWNEAYIDGRVYVVNFNEVIDRDISNFYETYGWMINSTDYHPDWWKK